MSATTEGEPAVDRGRTTAVGDATRERLMQAAERLIAKHGIEGVSVRDITAAARTNLGSIHYHFLSKEGLVRAIIEDRAQRLGDRRLNYLRALGETSPNVHQVAEAVVRPTFEFVSGGDEDSDKAYVGFLAALLDDATMVPALDHYFGDQYEAYCQALQQARPDLSREVLINRISFALHLVLNTASEPARGLRTWIERHHPASADQIQADLIEFVAGGFAAP